MYIHVYIHTCECMYKVSYRGEGREDIPPSLSPSLRFQTRCISTCNNTSTTSILGPHKPPEATSESLKSIDSFFLI